MVAFCIRDELSTKLSSKVVQRKVRVLPASHNRPLLCYSYRQQGVFCWIISATDMGCEGQQLPPLVRPHSTRKRHLGAPVRPRDTALSNPLCNLQDCAFRSLAVLLEFTSHRFWIGTVKHVARHCLSLVALRARNKAISSGFSVNEMALSFSSAAFRRSMGVCDGEPRRTSSWHRAYTTQRCGGTCITSPDKDVAN